MAALYAKTDEREYALRCAATVTLPSWMTLRWHHLAEENADLRIRASHDVRLRLKALGGVSTVKARPESSEEWADVPVQRLDDDLVILLPVTTLGAGWCEIHIGEAG